MDAATKWRIAGKYRALAAKHDAAGKHPVVVDYVIAKAERAERDAKALEEREAQ